MKVQCCVCNKMREGEQWVNPEPAILASESVSHGYCPSCLEQAHREIRALRYGLSGLTQLAANQ